MNEAIIAAVLKRDPVWNPTNEDHRNVYVLKKLWKEIAAEVKEDVKRTKARWKNLRAYFYKEEAKIEESKGRTVKKGYSTWQYYDQMSFLKSYNFVPEKDFSLSGDDNDSMIICEVPVEEQNLVHSNSGSESITSHSQEPPKKKPRVAATANRSENNDQLLEIEKNRLEVLGTESVKEKRDDLFFFKSLLPYMSNIPPVRKLRLRSKIQDLILAELETTK